MEVREKLAILADAAKYDASCASAGRDQAPSPDTPGIAKTRGSEGRAVSLLKILLTNYCIYDCAYCVSRVSNDPPRALFTPLEIADLTMDYFRRGYIQGLFLSSGVLQSPDYTMEQMIEAARLLREEKQFGGYIHLKAVPGASPELLSLAGRYADRLSANIELPRAEDLVQLAPAKTHQAIEDSMATIHRQVLETRASRRRDGPRPAFAPSGQTTQMLVGATAATDRDILAKAAALYGLYDLRRVYYTGFSPIDHAAPGMATVRPPVLREHRLYQADWLFRFYDFTPDELATEDDGSLSLEQDPKLAWALRHRDFYPVDVNAASREALLRVPGLGLKNADRILRLRRFHKVTMEDLRRLRVSVRKALPFLIAAEEWDPAGDSESAKLAARLRRPLQLELFDAAQAALTGEF